MLSVTPFVPCLACSVLDDWVIQKYKLEKDSTTGEKTRVLGERECLVCLQCLAWSRAALSHTRLMFVSFVMYNCIPTY